MARAGFFIAFVVVGYGVSAAVLAWVNPVIYRARSGFQPGTEGWDLILLSLLMPAMVAEIPVATLRRRQNGVVGGSPAVVAAGYVLLAASMVVTAWAQAVNPLLRAGRAASAASTS